MQPPCLLEDHHCLLAFDCGQDALNDYLRKYALLSQKTGAGRTHVILDQERVVAFYTLASASVSMADAPERLQKGLPRHLPVPAVLLGRFAVDRQYQGRGLGKALLRDALRRIARLSEDVGMRAVIVDAKDETALNFYLQLGFVRFTPHSMRLYLLLKDLRKTLAGDGPPTVG